MSKIEEFFEKAVAAGIIPQTPMNYDAVAYKIYTGYLENKIDELTAENADLYEKLKEAEHRAEVAERALLLACANLVKDEKDNIDIELLARVLYTKFLRKAEKELAEEKKDD